MAVPGQKQSSLQLRELLADKATDFVLIFVGLYAAIAVQRHQDVQSQKGAYLALLSDFDHELATNLAQEEAIAKDVGDVAKTEAPDNLGPMAGTFDAFFRALAEDEKIVRCLHGEFAAKVQPASGSIVRGAPDAACHAAYAAFDAAHGEGAEGAFAFTPAALTPFYRYEVWQLYLADGVKIFRNKELAMKLGQIYENARIVERQVADIEATYNDSFMKQVGRSAATDAELADLVHDEEEEHGLSPHNRALLVHVGQSLKEERYATKEAKSILELKVERMKKTVLTMRSEIEAVRKAIAAERDALTPR